MNNKTAIALAAVIVVLVGGALIYKSAKNDGTKNDVNSPSPSVSPIVSVIGSPQGNIPPTSSPSPIVSVSAEAGAVRQFIVLGNNFSFLPAGFSVNKGEKVRIVFQNNAGVHDFKIDEFKVATKVLKEGQTETVEFIADKTGSFEFYCSVGNHRAQGMKGTLIVN